MMDNGHPSTIEQRLQMLEDRLAIYQLLATYGPGVDSLSQDVIAGMWAEDGVYEIVGLARYESGEAVGEMLNGEMHQRYVNTGCGHVISMPHVVIEGDTAIATGHATIYLRDGDHWRIERLSAARWEFVRTTSGWRVKHRTNQPLTGHPGARDQLGRELHR